MKAIIRDLIEKQIIQEQDYINEHNAIRGILSPLAGQPISGRLLNKKRLNGFIFKPQYGMFYICGKYEHLIGYDSEPIISIDKNDNTRGFEYFDACHGTAAQSRINQLKNIDINKLVKIFGAIKDNFENLCTLFGDVERQNLGSFHNPIYYDLLRAIKPDESKPGDKLRLSDFYYIRK